MHRRTARINRNGAFPVTIRIDESEVIAYRESVEKIRATIHKIIGQLEDEKDLGLSSKKAKKFTVNILSEIIGRMKKAGIRIENPCSTLT